MKVKIHPGSCTLVRESYQCCTFWNMSLVFWLDASGLSCIFVCSSTIFLSLRRPKWGSGPHHKLFVAGNSSPLTLHGCDLKLLSIKINGTELKVLHVIYFCHVAWCRVCMCSHDPHKFMILRNKKYPWILKKKIILWVRLTVLRRHKHPRWKNYQDLFIL